MGIRRAPPARLRPELLHSFLQEEGWEGLVELGVAHQAAMSY